MSVLFTSANSDRLMLNTLAVTAKPLSMACWFNVASSGTNRTFVSIGKNNATSQRNNIYFGTSTTGKIAVRQFVNEAFSSVNTTTSHSTGVWQFAGAVLPTSGNAKAVLNTEIVSGTFTTTTPPGMNATAVGAQHYLSSGWADYMNGYVAEAAIWNVALTDADLGILAVGFSPELVRPEALVFYAPLIGSFRDSRTTIMSSNGSPAIADHNRIYY